MKLLLVEDNPADADFLAASLRRQRAGDIELVNVQTLAEAAAQLSLDKFDVVLLDLHLPDGSGLQCLDAIQAVDNEIPIVVLSGQDDEEFAVSILNKGAQDYLVKWEGQGRTILRSIRYAIQRKKSDIRLNYLAQYDPLTGIPNRQFFNDQLTRATARARRDGRKVTLLFGSGANAFRSAHRLLGFSNADIGPQQNATAPFSIDAPFPYDLGDDPKVLRVTVYVNGTEATPMYYETRDEEECTFLMYIGSLPSILQTQSDPCCTNAVPLLRMSDYGSKVVQMQQTLQKIDRIGLRFGVHLPSSSSSAGFAPAYNFRNQNVLVVLRLWEVAEAGKRTDSFNRSSYVPPQRA